MNTQEVANKLVDYCKNGQFAEATANLLSDNAVSIESDPNAPVVKGLQNIIQKGKAWEATYEVHDFSISEPVVGGEYFSCAMSIDCTNKELNERSKMSEICLYQVKNGKIVSEQFFYGIPEN